MRTALVLGAAACVWDDVEAARRFGPFAGAVGCNDLGVVWPGRLDAWVTLHADLFGGYVSQRQARGLPPHHRLLVKQNALESEPKLSPAVTGGTDPMFPGQTFSGTSGLFAAKVALIDLGYDRAILCGMPISDEMGHLENATKPWVGAVVHRQGWLQALPEIKDRVRSMSGWTQGLLGAPTHEWLRGQ